MNKGQRKLLIGKLPAAVALAAAAFAFSAQAAEDYKTVEAVSVTAEALKIDTSTEETPQTVNVISHEELDNKILRKVDDALRYTPGFVNPYGADYDSNWIHMRGFEVTTLIDGQTQYKEGFFDTTVEPFGLEAIEVRSGIITLRRLSAGRHRQPGDEEADEDSAALRDGYRRHPEIHSGRARYFGLCERGWLEALPPRRDGQSRGFLRG